MNKTNNKLDGLLDSLTSGYVFGHDSESTHYEDGSCMSCPIQIPVNRDDIRSEITALFAALEKERDELRDEVVTLKSLIPKDKCHEDCVVVLQSGLDAFGRQVKELREKLDVQNKLPITTELTAERYERLVKEFRNDRDRIAKNLVDVLAVLNGDGGHYQGVYGDEAAVNRGLGRWNDLYVRVDKTESENKELREKLAASNEKNAIIELLTSKKVLVVTTQEIYEKIEKLHTVWLKSKEILDEGFNHLMPTEDGPIITWTPYRLLDFLYSGTTKRY